jgi:nucleoside-triphosphatase
MNNKVGKVFIFSEEVQSGKSAMLVKWIEHKSVTGFLTPTVDYYKVFFNIQNYTIRGYEVDPSNDAIEVGNFFLSKEAFVEAKKIVKIAIKQNNKQWLIMDEIGKLELEGYGHHDVLLDVLKNWKNCTLLVVRDYLLDEVIKKYNITNPTIIRKSDISNNTVI